MNSQNPNSGQMPNVPMQQAQYALIGATTENIRNQEASTTPWQTFLPQQDRENLINRFLQALRQYTRTTNDQIVVLSRSLEQQCYATAVNLQAYYALCSQRIVQIASTGQQQKLMSQFSGQMQQQQGNTPMQAQKMQQMQQGNVPQLQGQSMQGMQAQQMQNHPLLQKHLHMQPQQQGGNPSNTLQTQQMQNQQNLLAQMSQNMGLNLNAANFIANNMSQGGINPPNLGRPRPNQGLPTGQFPGASVAPGIGNQSPANNVQPMRPPVGLLNGLPAGIPSIGNLTPQQFAQLSTNPNFLTMLQQRGINPQHAKTFLYNQMQNAVLASQISGNANMQSSNQADLNPASNGQPNSTTANNAGATNSAPSPGFQKSNMEPTYSQQSNVSASYNQTSNPTSMQSTGNEFSQSPAIGSQQHPAQFLNQKQVPLNNPMHFRPQVPVQGQGMAEARSGFNPNGTFTYPQFIKAVEQSRVELMPKIKALMDTCKAFPIREDVSQEEREQIYSFFPKIPSLLKMIDNIIPFIYVLTSCVDIPKPLIIFKAILETQLNCQPSICMTLDHIDKIQTQVSLQAELVKSRVQKLNMVRMADQSASNNPQSQQESPMKQEGSSLQPSTKSQPSPFVNASPRDDANSGQPSMNQTTRPQESMVSRASLLPSSAEPLPQAQFPPGPKTQTNLPPKIEEAAEPVQAFKSHIPNSDIALRLPTQKTATPKSDSEEPQQKSYIPESSNPSMPVKAEKSAPDHVLNEPPVKKARTQKEKTPAVPLTKLGHLEAEITTLRTKFKDQSMNYAMASLKKLKEIDESCRFRSNPVKILAGAARFGSSLLYNYDCPSSSLLSELPTTQHRSVFGFGDLPSSN